MNATIQETLLDLFQQVIGDPDCIPAVPIDAWPEESQEQHLLASFRDMLECIRQSKRQAEIQLREKEEQYRSIFEATIDGLSINDLEDGCVIEANPALCRMYGYTFEEFIDLPPTATLHPDSYHLAAEVLQQVQAGSPFQTRFVALRKDGTAFHAEGRGTPFIYKGKPHLLGSTRDITEQVQAEQQLREREEQYRSVFEATTDAMFISDLDGYVVEANPMSCNMYSYSYDELIGMHGTVFTPVDLHSRLGEVLQILQAGGQYQGQSVALRKDGTAFPIEVYVTTFTYKGKPHLLAVVRDISERLQAEKQLREKEEEYRSIFEASIDGLLIIDQENHVVEANPAACQIHGYTREEMLGRSPSSEVINVRDIIQTGGKFHTREKGVRKDGTSFHSEVRGTPLTYKGKPHMLGIVRDITEQVEAEEQLREREELYRSIFDATYDALNIIDLDGFLVEANPAFCNMFGYTREELIGLHIGALAAPVSQHVVTEALETYQSGSGYQTVGQGLRKDGTVFHIESHSTTLSYRGRPHALGVSRDITERVEAEKQVREKEEQYRAVFEATTDALVVLDPDGFYVEANPAMCRLYGYTNEELIGLHTSGLTAPESFHVLTESMEKIKGGRGFQAEGQGLRKDGSVFYAEAHLTPFTYQGKPHLLASTRDITERVQAQQLLEQRVEERTRELSTLLEVSRNVASTIDLKLLLDLILDQLRVVVDYAGSAITILEGEDLVLVGTRGPESEEHLVQHRFPLKFMGPIWEALCRGELVVIDNMQNDTPTARAYRETVSDLLETTFGYVRSWVAVPLKLKDQVIGMLSISHSKPNFYTPHHAELALAIANQAAVAIENARLYAQAQELAALEERQKLARELHDSVSQALYGISLGAHAARTALSREPDEVAEPLDYVLSLAEAALSEMRALIFELRPESLESEGLVSALTKQAAATQARHELVVIAELCDEPDLPLRAKQELYRIAQEAMHNIVKHAHAGQVVLRLEQIADEVALEVRDNGVGFDPTASFPGHLGLHSMRERVSNLGGTFGIESEPGAGTRVYVSIPGSK
jgi:PAS domain S-box-containing protein